MEIVKGPSRLALAVRRKHMKAYGSARYGPVHILTKIELGCCLRYHKRNYENMWIGTAQYTSFYLFLNLVGLELGCCLHCNIIKLENNTNHIT